MSGTLELVNGTHARGSQKRVKNVLLVYPEFFPTYWGMQYYLPLVGQKSLMPPLGLITIAALTPPGFEFRLVVSKAIKRPNS